MNISSSMVRNRTALAIPALLALGLVGCGGDSFTKDDLAQARTVVNQAEGDVEQVGAIAYATAKDKLARAERLLEEGEEERAEQLAKEARLDAQFAAAVSTAQSAQRAAQELSASIEMLRREAARGSSSTSPASPSAPSGSGR